VQALEHAEEMEEVVVLYMKKDGGAGFFESQMTLAQVNYYLDLFKRWLLAVASGEKKPDD
jgi:hypothetical protein